MREAQRWIGPAALVVPDAPVGRTDLELVVPRAAMATAFVVGRVLGPDGEALPGAGLHWKPLDGATMTYREEAKAESGEFRLGPQPAGRYRFDVSAPSFGTRTIGERDLAVGQTLDLGTIELEKPGRVHVVLDLAEGVSLDRGAFVSFALEGDPPVNPNQVKGREVHSPMLAPGRYEVQFSGSELRAAPIVVDVPADETVETRLRVERGTWRVVDVRWDTRSAPRGLEFEARDASGALVLHGRAIPTGEGSARIWAHGLAVGTCTVRVTSIDGRSVAGAFDVESLEPPDEDSATVLELWIR